jgi:hypothetical protein
MHENEVGKCTNFWQIWILQLCECIIYVLWICFSKLEMLHHLFVFSVLSSSFMKNVYLSTLVKIDLFYINRTYFPKNILGTSYSPFFCHQVMKFCHNKECLQLILKIHLMKFDLFYSHYQNFENLCWKFRHCNSCNL